MVRMTKMTENTTRKLITTYEIVFAMVSATWLLGLGKDDKTEHTRTRTYRNLTSNNRKLRLKESALPYFYVLL